MKSEAKRVFIDTCVQCGVEFERPRGRHKEVCFECGAAALVDAATQLKNKAGPLYEKAVRKQVLYWRSEALRLRIRV